MTTLICTISTSCSSLFISFLLSPDITHHTMASTITTPDAATGSTGRAGRLPRWSRQEILILIQGKTAYERGMSTSAKPKWSSVSSYCRRHGVDRGPLQCRKRWSNLACDFKKIKGWEGRKEKGAGETLSYWEMRSDERRERKLSGFFDPEVFELMDGEGEIDREEEEEEEVFDSGRSGKEYGLISDGDEEDNEEPPLFVTPLSEKKYESFENEHSDPGNWKDKQTDNNPEKGSSSWEGQKRRKTSKEDPEDTDIENKLIKVLERNGRIISDQLEAQNLSCQLEREQRKDQANSLVSILTKLADALGKIADKL